jgi:hypothetical protein
MYGPKALGLLGLITLASQVVNALPAAQAQEDPDPDVITTEQMEDAFPPRDPANTKNWYGTSLYGWE